MMCSLNDSLNCCHLTHASLIRIRPVTPNSHTYACSHSPLLIYTVLCHGRVVTPSKPSVVIRHTIQVIYHWSGPVHTNARTRIDTHAQHTQTQKQAICYHIHGLSYHFGWLTSTQLIADISISEGGNILYTALPNSGGILMAFKFNQQLEENLRAR